MNTSKFLPAMLLLTAFAAASCAIDPDESANLSLDRVMTAWINVNHPGLQPYGEHGAYLLDLQKGEGPAVTDSAYVWVHYTKKALDQSVLASNIQAVDEQLGQYAAGNYYGSDIWRVDQGFLPDGIEEVLKTLRSGSKASIALPSSSSGHSYSRYSAFSGTSEVDNYLYELTIDTVMTDIYDYQAREMQEWFREHYETGDTLSTGFYFKKLTEKTEDSDTIPEGNNINVRYIGRLLSGHVFDTNIEDTAKFYRLWTSGSSYTALGLTYYAEEAKFIENNSVVEGFSKAVSRMNYGETAVALFSPELGYGEGGSGKSVPEYAPLIFWLYIEPKL